MTPFYWACLGFDLGLFYAVGLRAIFDWRERR